MFVSKDRVYLRGAYSANMLLDLTSNIRLVKDKRASLFVGTLVTKKKIFYLTMSSSNNTKADIQPQATGIAELFEKSSSEIVEKMNNFRRKKQN